MQECGHDAPSVESADAQADSRRLRRSALGEVDLSQGRYWVVMGAEPTSYAIQIDMPTMVPWQEWPTQPVARCGWRLSRRANPNLRDRNGVTPLQMAEIRGYTEMVLMLKNAGAH